MKKVLMLISLNISVITLMQSTAFADYSCKAELKHKDKKTSAVIQIPKGPSEFTEDDASSVVQIENIKFGIFESTANMGSLDIEISKGQPGNSTTPFFTIANMTASAPAVGKTISLGVYLNQNDKAIISCLGL